MQNASDGTVVCRGLQDRRLYPGDMRKVDLIRRRIRLYIDQERRPRRPPGRKRRHAWINNALCQY